MESYETILMILEIPARSHSPYTPHLFDEGEKLAYSEGIGAGKCFDWERACWW